MRLAGIIAAIVLVGAVALQSLFGGTPDSEADDRIVLAESDICTVEVATLPVLTRQTRSFVVTPEYKELTVTPARFGTRTETVTVTPEHHEGATFFAESKRVIVSEPTRRLRAVAAVIEPDLVFESREVVRPRVEGGKLVEQIEELPPLPDNQIVIEKARIEAVRINAGLRMLDIQIIDEDGEGELVPAETVEIEVRTVEEDPVVNTNTVAAITETAEIDIVEIPSERVERPAVCTIGTHEALIRRVQQAITGDEAPDAGSGEWSAGTIDAMAAAQVAETGVVSPYLLIETVRAWMPDVVLPTGS